MLNVRVTPVSCSCVERVVLSAAPAAHRPRSCTWSLSCRFHADKKCVTLFALCCASCLSFVRHPTVCGGCEVKTRKCQTGAAGLLSLIGRSCSRRDVKCNQTNSRNSFGPHGLDALAEALKSNKSLVALQRGRARGRARPGDCDGNGDAAVAAAADAAVARAADASDASEATASDAAVATASDAAVAT
eukprot:2196042-Pleurochrysis_carterae.AAC.1